MKNIDRLRRAVVPPSVQTRYALTRDDVLINRVNSLSHIGKATLVPSLQEPTIFESNMMRVRCGPHLLPEFLNTVLCSNIARKHWLARAKPAVNQASINQRDVDHDAVWRQNTARFRKQREDIRVDDLVVGARQWGI